MDIEIKGLTMEERYNDLSGAYEALRDDYDIRQIMKNGECHYKKERD